MYHDGTDYEGSVKLEVHLDIRLAVLRYTADVRGQMSSRQYFQDRPAQPITESKFFSMQTFHKYFEKNHYI